MNYLPFTVPARIYLFSGVALVISDTGYLHTYLVIVFYILSSCRAMTWSPARIVRIIYLFVLSPVGDVDRAVPGPVIPV